MSENATARVGPPRFDSVERLRHRFYEPLILFWMLNPATGPVHALPVAGQHCSDFTSLWIEFLDALSWFCDYLPGGAAVSSVAAEQTHDGNCFWLASATDRALPHLSFILSILESVPQMSSAERLLAIDTIAETSIKFSNTRIRKYRYELGYNVRSAREKTTEAMLPGTEVLLQTLDEMTKTLDNPLRLCEIARDFDQHRELNRLIEATTTISLPSRWASVRHYVARLRSWHRKSVQLVSFAGRFGELLERATCKWLPLPKSVGMPESDSKSNLMSALRRMLPKHEQHRVQEIHDAVAGFRGFEFADNFAESYKGEKLSLLVHSEVFLMEHFYFNGLPFVNNYRYVGCSKASCYCCSLYMRYHPGNFVVRASHGTAWVTWSPPLQSKVDDPAMGRHNLDLMNQVIQHLRRDVLIELENRFLRRRRLPDSSSGMVSLSY